MIKARTLSHLFLFVITLFTCANSMLAQVVNKTELQEITYFCSADSTLQPAMFYAPTGEKQRPLLIGLHPWSSNYKSYHGPIYAEHCKAREWFFIFPNFRGANNKPIATGSDFVVQDIVDAVNYCIANYNIDTNRIYLAGASGGGYTALLMAGKRPNIWAGVSAWVPITDLQKWYVESQEMGNDYWKDIYNSCEGDPLSDSLAILESIKRSPINFLSNKTNMPIDINAGIHDGHNGYAVPISHSLLAFNKLALPQDTLSNNQINTFVNEESVPKELQNEKEHDELYGSKEVLFRRTSQNARITIFNGIHEIIYEAAIDWLSKQSKNVLAIEDGINSQGIFNYKLFQNYPNPFNPATTIKYSIPSSSVRTEHPLFVQLIVYDILGREVATLVNKQQTPGNYSVTFDASNLSSGLYFYRISAGNFTDVKKMMLLK